MQVQILLYIIIYILLYIIIYILLYIAILTINNASTNIIIYNYIH
jgi:hypothetical protein